MDLNAVAQLSALVVAVLNAHADPSASLNPHPDILTTPRQKLAVQTASSLWAGYFVQAFFSSKYS